MFLCLCYSTARRIWPHHIVFCNFNNTKDKNPHSLMTDYRGWLCRPKESIRGGVDVDTALWVVTGCKWDLSTQSHCGHNPFIFHISWGGATPAISSLLLLTTSSTSKANYVGWDSEVHLKSMGSTCARCRLLLDVTPRCRCDYSELKFKPIHCIVARAGQ